MTNAGKALLYNIIYSYNLVFQNNTELIRCVIRAIAFGTVNANIKGTQHQIQQIQIGPVLLD